MPKRNLTRVPKAKFNVEGLTCMVKRRSDLRKAVEEADWLGEADRADDYYHQLVFVEDQIAKGYLYDPAW